MQSNAGSTRRVKYLVALAAGLALSLLAIAVSFWASYYSSPRMLSERVFEIRVEGEASVTLALANATGEKLYYDVYITSSPSIRAYLVINAAGELREIYLGEGLSIQRRGEALLSSPPQQVSLVLRCSECTAKGSLSVRYYSVDYDLLLAMNIVAVVSSLIGIALVAAGGYGYMLERRSKG